MTTPRLVGNRYELGELIGYGGMAEVHRGLDVRLGREVAIKVLRPDLARDPSFLNRFRREAQSAAGLNHPSIVAVYDTGEDLIGTDGEQAVVPYIVMEYVEGRTLRDILKSEGPLPPRRAMQIIGEVCAALDYSHRSGIVHRDIKPANVMITNAGAVKVMDFGIARAVADNSATVTQTAAVIGTAQYLSPEQARGETVDARSDVYSAGCVLYELVTGTPPFTGDSPVAVAYQHVRENAPLPSSINHDLPRSVDSIAMKALAKNPQNRYQSAGEMRSDLMRAVSDQPVQAESVLTDEERTQFIARTDGGRRPPIVPMGDDDDPEANHRRGALIWTAVVVALLLVIVGTGFAVVQLNRNTKVKTATMPSLIGQTPQNAENMLQQLGLQVGDMTTSPGPCGDNPQSAQTTVDPGKVCTQQFASGQAVTLNTKVGFTVYKAPTIKVPNLSNQTLQQAEATLQTDGLTGTVTTQNKDVFSPGANMIVDQSPKPYTYVLPGQAFIVVVSSGKEAIPDVRGQKYEAAKAKLNTQGFSNVGAPKYQPTSDQSKDDVVADQNPLTGTFPSDVAITLTVYQYVKPTPVVTGTCPASSSTTPSGRTSTSAAASSSGSALTTCTPAPSTAPTSPTAGSSPTATPTPSR